MPLTSDTCFEQQKEKSQEKSGCLGIICPGNGSHFVAPDLHTLFSNEGPEGCLYTLIFTPLARKGPNGIEGHVTNPVPQIPHQGL
jgi:hypothetical protein